MTVAFVFPGQGSQSVGMQQALAADFPVVGETYSEASDALGFDLWELAQNGPAESLDETVNTQPAMLTAGVATWRAVGKGKHKGYSPCTTFLGEVRFASFCCSQPPRL